jgi:hypothetical protein
MVLTENAGSLVSLASRLVRGRERPLTEYATPPEQPDAKGRHAFAAHVSAYEAGWRLGLAEGLAVAVASSEPVERDQVALTCLREAEQRGLGPDFLRELARRGITLTR